MKTVIPGLSESGRPVPSRLALNIGRALVLGVVVLFADKLAMGVMERALASTAASSGAATAPVDTTNSVAAPSTPSKSGIPKNTAGLGRAALNTGSKAAAMSGKLPSKTFATAQAATRAPAPSAAVKRQSAVKSKLLLAKKTTKPAASAMAICPPKKQMKAR
ncbi:hypothetical protein [Deinococcus sp.]|uniref:hypothetical protein n=1 Tax=Deinococcus sp. TaxID=47478 RepID=UPI003B5AE320